jgi:predicted permease
MFRRKREPTDFSAEIEAHIHLETERLREQGLSEDEARIAARRAFGNVTRAKEQFYESRRWLWWDHLRQDIRFGLRVLRKSPGFTVVAILTLALGIGANTAIFSLINAVALRSLPVPDPQQLVLFEWAARSEPNTIYFASFGGCPWGRGGTSSLTTACSFSYPMFQQIRGMQDVFSGVLSFVKANAVVRIEGHPGRLQGMYVSGDFFSTLGARAIAGRTLDGNDDISGAEPVIVLSYRYWRNELGADPAILGKTAAVNLKPFRIVGITGRDFPDFDPGVPVDFWTPLAAEPILNPHPPSRTAPNALWLYVLARLKPGVTNSRVQSELNAMFVPSTTTGPAAIFKTDDTPRITIYNAAEGLASLRTEYAKSLYVLMIVVGLVLLLACANIAGLTLARSSARQKEMAVRNALGAPQLRIVRQLLTENLMLAAAGGALGILFAELGARSLVAFLSANSYVPIQLDVGIDWHVLGFTLAVCAVAGILFGLAPALRGSRVDVAPILKLTGAQSGSTPRQSAHLSVALVLIQVVTSILVLLGAGLLGRSVRNLETEDTGFKANNILVFSVDMTASGLKIDDPRCDKLNQELRNRFAALPGVSSASYSELPMLGGGGDSGQFIFPGAPASSAFWADLLPIGPGFFETMEIPLLAGRTFTAADFEPTAKPKPIIVNQSFVRRYLGKGDPLGRVLGYFGPQDPDLQVIGVVGDTRYESIRKEVGAMIFTPFVYRSPTFELRTQRDPKGLISMVRDSVGRVNSDFLIFQAKTQSEEIDRTIYQERLVAGLSALFGLLALTLASIGLYGLVAYGVARRTHEIGIRMALGARRHEILWLTGRLGLVLTLTGIVIGLAVAAGAMRYLESLLYGVRATDPWTFACIPILFGVVVALACYVPARRATRVDPMVALRHE